MSPPKAAQCSSRTAGSVVGSLGAQEGHAVGPCQRSSVLSPEFLSR